MVGRMYMQVNHRTTEVHSSTLAIPGGSRAKRKLCLRRYSERRGPEVGFWEVSPGHPPVGRRFLHAVSMVSRSAWNRKAVVMGGMAGARFRRSSDRIFTCVAESPTAITHDLSVLCVFSSVWQSHGSP